MSRLVTSLAFALVGCGVGIGHAACWRTPEDVEGISIIASQAGAPVTGHFRRFQGRLCLPDESTPGAGRVDIETASIDMGMPEFDAELRGPLFLDATQWPNASFVARRIEPEGPDHYRVTGDLTLRDVTREVQTEFEAKPNGARLALATEFSIQRLDYDIGLGEWQDTEWVGNEVTVKIDTVLVPCSRPDAAL